MRSGALRCHQREARRGEVEELARELSVGRGEAIFGLLRRRVRRAPLRGGEGTKDDDDPSEALPHRPVRHVTGGRSTLGRVGDVMTFSIRRMARDDLDLAVTWAAAEGWNPGQLDAETFYATDADGFLVGELDGVAIGSISVVAYDDRFGFLGLYIVRPGHRGKGYGLALWQAGMAYLAGRNVGLDGVVAQQGNYGKSGFASAFRHLRYEGAGRAGLPRPVDVEPLGAFSFDEVLAYDTRHFPTERRRFLEPWLAMPNLVGFGVRRGGRLAGYGCVRTAHRGKRIGPLFADDPAVARSLFAALAETADGQPLFLDAPEPNADAAALAREHGMTAIFETARMYTGPFPSLPLAEIYGITSLELG
ncbi:GNAT family N-acetyltransferase [Sorangium sp. So ce131]|uniref:GNAT family N-acetyltransferase n=1 Tax=Sorangium sp. So ce131 TaxID=3133282 RepID=UPI003F5F70B8